MPESLIVEVIQMAGCGSCSQATDSDVISKAVSLMRQCEEDRSLPDFEDVAPFLKKNGCSASDVFMTEVTESTEKAWAAYLTYCVE